MRLPTTCRCDVWGKTALIAVCALWCAASLAQANGDDSDKVKQTKELTKALQNAQLLLSGLSDAFDCDYVGYDVTPTDMGNRTTYMVVIEVEDETCDEMVRALNYEGAEQNLAFVSEIELPEMNPLPDPPRPYQAPPEDYTLIHEINPPEEL